MYIFILVKFLVVLGGTKYVKAANKFVSLHCCLSAYTLGDRVLRETFGEQRDMTGVLCSVQILHPW